MLVHQFSILEEQYGRNIANTVFGGNISVFVYIAFTDKRFAFIFAGQFFNDRTHHLQGPHHGAQKSITTGLPSARISLKLLSVISNAISSKY